ncbi:MAG: hypothetical protein AUK37_09910 [Rhodobacterales bacterium CG2_30_65_12]|nr:MAG: hypothetical protein AUK37_09910 [Rhodobacterales bacterium CG2_30_65_12]
MKILVLNTGLFPDAARVEEAVETLNGPRSVAQADVRGLAPDDKDGWAIVAEAILAADRVVTL